MLSRRLAALTLSRVAVLTSARRAVHRGDGTVEAIVLVDDAVVFGKQRARGDVVSVKAGTMRNHLYPKRIADYSTAVNKALFAREKQVRGLPAVRARPVRPAGFPYSPAPAMHARRSDNSLHSLPPSVQLPADWRARAVLPS